MGPGLCRYQDLATQATNVLECSYVVCAYRKIEFTSPFKESFADSYSQLQVHFPDIRLEFPSSPAKIVKLLTFDGKLNLQLTVSTFHLHR
ncbi:Uncharacterized protein HZ326_29638, partial [Fusarium oxysporum f. sp. albedinis]